MADLVEIKAKIVATEGKLTLAENSGIEALILMYGNNLAELRRKENNLEVGAGKSIIISFHCLVLNL
jgi:hypothetical protein